MTVLKLLALSLVLTAGYVLEAADSATTPLKPAGTVTLTRAPLFRWSTTRTPSSFTIELSRDGVRQPLVEVPANPKNNWQCPTNLDVGDYIWRVKAGKEDSTLPWSPRLAFSIPPLQPVPLQPEGRVSTNAAIPTFTWQNPDPEANRFVLQLFNNSDLLGSLSRTGSQSDFSADWTNTLPTGIYSWRIRAVRVTPNHTISSGWTPPVFFQLGVPGSTSLTNPLASTEFPAGTTVMDISWKQAAGANSYDLKILQNNKLLNKINTVETAGRLTSTFFPAYYTFIVRGVNSTGNGPWSTPVTVTVRRNMNPDGTVTNLSPKAFKWSRTEPATYYRLKLDQFNATSGKYVEALTTWIAQPAAGNPKWVPGFRIPNGKFRWTITDFNGQQAGYSQAAFFQIKNSGYSNWNDPNLIVGTWKVVTDWRWREMTFFPNGVLETVQGDGTAFQRARWSADTDILTMVSDVTERCPYTLTPTTLTFTLPSGNVKVLTRIR
jgi:hypothetical protein